MPYRYLRPFAVTLLLGPLSANAQNELENVIVETYYISSAADAVPTEGGTLAEGSTTYRVFLDLCDSCAFLGLYGSQNHPLSISSTAPFYNNLDRGMTFGHELNNGWMDENTAAVDSWLAFGAANSSRFGVMKSEDPDSVSEEIFPNDLDLLGNNDPLAGIPLTQADGLVQDTSMSPVPTYYVFGESPDSAFGDTTQATSFSPDTTSITCQQPGVRGHGIGNKILIAQLTTTGELTFCLNVEIVRADGSVQRYVSSDTLLAADETASGLLCYPPVCGCTDPDFLEYDPTAGCDDGSCATAIVFGCLDPAACNFDPSANFNITALCCYGPDSCNGLDPQLVCPGVGLDAPMASEQFSVFPNPVSDRLHLTLARSTGPMTALLLDRSGRVVRQWRPSPSTMPATLDIADLAPGVYLLHVIDTAVQHVRVITKL